MAAGKLYNDQGYLVDVNYRLFNEQEHSWWGELVFTEFRKVEDGSYIFENAAGKRGRCVIRKKVNKAVSSVPPLFFYRFHGTSVME